MNLNNVVCKWVHFVRGLDDLINYFGEIICMVSIHFNSDYCHIQVNWAIGGVQWMVRRPPVIHRNNLHNHLLVSDWCSDDQFLWNPQLELNKQLPLRDTALSTSYHHKGYVSNESTTINLALMKFKFGWFSEGQGFYDVNADSLRTRQFLRMLCCSCMIFIENSVYI